MESGGTRPPSRPVIPIVAVVAGSLHRGRSGSACFTRDVAGSVLQTESTHARRHRPCEHSFNYLDLKPKGRDEAGRGQFWFRCHGATTSTRIEGLRRAQSANYSRTEVSFGDSKPVSDQCPYCRPSMTKPGKIPSPSLSCQSAATAL